MMIQLMQRMSKFFYIIMILRNTVR